MAVKERKANIHIETRITHILSGWKATQQTETKTSLHVLTLSKDIWYTLTINGAYQPGMFPYDPEFPEADRFNTNFWVNARIGDTVVIEAYRVPETIATARFVGTCSGSIQEIGFVADSKENVTTQESNEVKTVRKYR